MKNINLLVPEFASKRLVSVALGASVCAVAIASTILPQKASAQALNPVLAPSNVTTQQSEQDTMYGQSGDFNVMNLIHRSQIGTGELTDPGKSISDAATRFRLEQQRQLNQPSNGNLQQQLPQNPTSNSQPSN
ncbi:MAG: hypothetical protein WBG73_19955 [Coleofasciculaceae cyanobacterium]